MASWKSNFNSSYELELIVTQESQNIANNTSVVRARLIMRRLAGSGNYSYDQVSTYSMVIDGTTYSGKFAFDFRNGVTTKELRNITKTVTHNSNGSKSISVSATSRADLVVPATATISAKSFGLTTIPRASTASLSGATATGSAITVSISRKATSFTHNVQYRVGSGSWINVATAATTSASFTVPHTAIAANGSATITVQVQTKSGSTNIGSVITLTRTVAGPKTNSIGTFVNFTIGNTIPFTITRPNSSFTSTARIYVGGTLVQTLTGLTTSGTFAANTATFLGKLPSNGSSVSVTIQLDTMSGNTKIGSTVSKTVTATGTAAQLQPGVPSITLAELGSGLGVYTQSKSRINVKSSSSTPYNSTITEYRVTVSNTNYFGSNINTNTINSSGSVTVTVRATNSRGYTRTNSASVTFNAYSPPKITKFTATRHPNQESTNLYITYAFDISPVANKNSRSVTIRYRRTGQSNTNLVQNTSNYSQNTTHTANGILNTNYSYEVDIVVSDSFTTISMTIQIGTGFELVNYNANGTGIAFGKISEKSNAVEFGVEAYDKNGTIIIGLGGTVVEY